MSAEEILREPWPTPGKPARRSPSWRGRGGQGCRGTRARRSRLLGQRHRPAVFRQTAATSRSARFFVRSKRPVSTARCARPLAAVRRRTGVSPRDERTGQVAAAGRRTRHAPTTDGNRVRKRSGHAAPDSTMALELAVSPDDCWLSPGSPQAACASSAPALEDTVAMPAVPGPRTRLARCGLTGRRTWCRLHRRQRADRASSCSDMGSSHWTRGRTTMKCKRRWLSR